MALVLHAVEGVGAGAGDRSVECGWLAELSKY